MTLFCEGIFNSYSKYFHWKWHVVWCNVWLQKCYALHTSAKWSICNNITTLLNREILFYPSLYGRQNNHVQIHYYTIKMSHIKHYYITIICLSPIHRSSALKSICSEFSTRENIMWMDNDIKLFFLLAEGIVYANLIYGHRLLLWFGWNKCVSSCVVC